jgi:hypothetical protein
MSFFDVETIEVGDLVTVERCLKLPNKIGVYSGECEVAGWMLICCNTDPTIQVCVPKSIVTFYQKRFKK